MWVSPEHRQVVCELLDYGNLIELQRIPQQLQGFLDYVVELHTCALRCVGTRQGEKIPHNALTASSGLMNLRHHLGQIAVHGLLPKQVRLHHEGGQGVVEFVCHAGQEPAQGRQLFALMQRFLLAPQYLLGPFNLRNILMSDDDLSAFGLVKARHPYEEPRRLRRTGVGILPGEGRTLARHHRPETSEELLEFGSYASTDGMAELQVIRPYTMSRGREVMGQHKTTSGSIDRHNRSCLLQDDNTGGESVERRLEKLIGVPECYLRALSFAYFIGEGVVGERQLGGADLGCLSKIGQGGQRDCGHETHE